MRFDRPDRRKPAGLSRKEQWRLIGLIGLFGLVLLAMDVASRPGMWTWIAPGEERPAAAVDSVFTPETPPPPGGIFEAGSFEGVKDNTVGFRRDDADAFRTVVSQLRDTQNRTLSVAARRDVTYSVLMADSDALRGTVVRLQGELRRLTPAVFPNDLSELPPMLEAWILTEDGGDRPLRILTLAADETLPRGEGVEPVRITTDAVFFKRYAYAAEGGGRVAPMFLAKKIAAVPVPLARPNDRLSPALLLLVAVPLLFVVYAFTRTVHQQKRRRGDFRSNSVTAGGPGLPDAESPSEFLSQLDVADAPGGDFAAPADLEGP